MSFQIVVQEGLEGAHGQLGGGVGDGVVLLMALVHCGEDVALALASVNAGVILFQSSQQVLRLHAEDHPVDGLELQGFVVEVVQLHQGIPGGETGPLLRGGELLLILAMTDDNLRQRETILPSEKALSLKMQYEAIKHQGARGDSAEAGKLSLESVGQRNGMSVKTVQRYIWLNDLVPELKQTMDDGKLSFTPAVEISRVRPKHQKYIAVSIEGQQASPSKGQAKRLRELDKENKLSPDVIDGILCEEKKKEDRDVIITGAELEKFFGKEATPRQMKDQIMTLLEDWKERQPPELAKPDKKMDMEK